LLSNLMLNLFYINHHFRWRWPSFYAEDKWSWISGVFWHYRSWRGCFANVERSYHRYSI